MSAVQRYFWAHMLVAVAAIAISYATAGHPLMALVFVFFGMVWTVARQQNAPGIGGLVLIIFLIAGGIGQNMGIPGWWLLVMTVAALGAWDLDHFLQRLSGFENVDYSSGLGSAHLRRLAMVEGLGFLAGLLALTTQARIGFWWAALLALLAVIGVRRLISYVRRQMDR